jgi:site-specific DNA recombinase
MREITDGKRVGIWVRVSPRSINERRGQEEKSESPLHHLRRAELYAEMKGWTVVETYKLIDVSGKDVAQHPETHRMLSDVRSGEITGLIFSKLARLGRKTDVLIQMLEVFREVEADLISLDESIDTSTPAGRNFFRFIASNAEWEREEITERMVKSVQIRAKLGKQMSGSAPLGYQWVKGVLVLHPEQAPVRRLIYELYLQHRRKGTVARLLNEAGYRSGRGRPFTPLAIERLILDPTAKGIHRLNYTMRSPDGKITFKPEREWEYAEVEPIVSEEVWEQAVQILNENRQPQNRPAKRAVQLFAGLVFCACGEKMYVKSNTPKYVCSKCLTKIPKDDLEFVFREQLHAFSLSPELIAQHLADADGALTQRVELLETLRKEDEKLGRQMEKTYKLYLEDRLSSEAFGKLYRPLEVRAAQLADELPRLQAEVDFARMQNLSRGEIAAAGETLYSRWGELDLAERRAIVETITERITVSGDEITIDLCYLPPGKDVANSGRSPPPWAAADGPNRFGQTPRRHVDPPGLCMNPLL